MIATMEEPTTINSTAPRSTEISIIAPKVGNPTPKQDLAHSMPAEPKVVAQPTSEAGDSANLPGKPVAGSVARNPGKEASTEIAEYIKPTMIRYPMYDYQTGRQFFLSKTERIVVDAYLKTNNVAESCRALNAIRGAHGSTNDYDVRSVKRWLQKPHVASYIAQAMLDKGKVNWFDQHKWEAWGVDAMQGKGNLTQVQVAIWKEFGKAKGWYKESGPQVLNNTQINFVQSDGRA